MGLLSGLFHSAPKPPTPPDPNVVANAQNQQNQRAALYSAGLNRYTTNTPYGSQRYQITGTDPVTGAPTYEQNLSLKRVIARAWASIRR